MEIGEGVVVGTCKLMCPEKEMKMREASGRLHFLERSSTARSQGRATVDRELAVKEFSRPAAGKGPVNPCDLRPANVLRRTVSYLLGSQIVCNADHPWYEIYNFVFDRLRSVRQDMVIQCIHGNDAISILEMNVRFLVYASYRLCSEPRDRFDPHINDTHLQECLKRLIVLYSTTSDDSSSSGHQEQFVALYLIINLGNTEAISLGLEMKPAMGVYPVFQAALALNLAWLKGNYVRAMRLIRGLPLLHAWAAHRHIGTTQCTTLKVMSSAFTSKALTFPLSVLADLLLFDSTAEAARLCTASGLTLPSDYEVRFSRSDFRCPPETPNQHCCWIDRKAKDVSLTEVLQGSNCYEQNHKLSSANRCSSDAKTS